MLGKKIDCLEWCFNRKYRIIPERYNFNLTGQIKTYSKEEQVKSLMT